MFEMKEVINSIICDLCYYEADITEDLLLADDLGIDSLRLVELIATLEERFNIAISETDLDPDVLKTVENVYVLTEKYVQ